nr:hypothetical protein [Beihai weivirus-like virus 21]
MVARTPKKTKLAKRRVRVAKRRNGVVKPTTRANATTVLAQGVGSVPKQPFGSVRARPSLACWDAKTPHHLSLPRPVGPYTTVRTTRRIQTDSRCMVFGSFKRPGETDLNSDEWSNTCALGSIDSSLNVASVNNAYVWATPLTFRTIGTSMATCCPSAVTVQILNPEPLQTTTGVIYAGVSSTQFGIGGRSQTWEGLFDSFVNYMSPRLLSAAKLALRGVQMSSYPLNMNPISEFTELMERADSTLTYTDAVEEPTGWAPMLVYNPAGVQLEYLVTTEWRVRFDLQNAASAGHIHHPMHHDGEWERLMRQASSLGHGVMDIAELVADAGEAAKMLRPLTQMPRMPAL